MAETCIVCLETLGEEVDVPESGSGCQDDAGPVAASTIPHPSNSTTQQAIASIKPCNHFLHDECLRAWSQKANSCPICRAAFNKVEVLDKVGGKFTPPVLLRISFVASSASWFYYCKSTVWIEGFFLEPNDYFGKARFEVSLERGRGSTVVSEYEVEDRKQVAEFDPSAWIEEEEEEDDGPPCPICNEANQPEVLLLCDACNAQYHTHCLGLEQVPDGNWFCMECESNGAYARAETYAESQPAPRSARRAPRTAATVRRGRRLMRRDHWLGAWSVLGSRIHDAVGLDLDFSEDDQAMAHYRDMQRRTDREQRDFARWQRRFNIAQRQGAGNVFRAAAPIPLRDATPQAPVESIEETRAWGAFEKAKEMDTSVSASRNRKRKSRSITGSPSETSAPPQEPERKLKRPRTRRVLDKPARANGSPPIASSSRISHGHERAQSPTARMMSEVHGEPSFLSSILKEVEMASTSDDDRSAFSATTTSGPNRVTSPSLDYSSPAASPASSVSYHTPRASSMTPPPHISRRPGSPLTLTSRIEPIFPPANYSPNRSPPENKSEEALELRQPRPRRQRPIALPRSQDASPTRAILSIEEKESINKLVKAALAPHWKSAELTKEQYADINRDVSRKLYDVVAGRSSEQEKSTWEKIATTEVATAVKALSA